MADYQQGLKGAMGGAAIGSTIMPGWGTAAGAIGGGLLGMFGGGGLGGKMMRRMAGIPGMDMGNGDPMLGGLPAGPSRKKKKKKKRRK